MYKDCVDSTKTQETENYKTAIDNFINNIELNHLSVTGIITHISDHNGQLIHLKMLILIEKFNK